MTRARTLADLGSASLATDAELASHAADTTSVHGVADTASLAVQSGVGLVPITPGSVVNATASGNVITFSSVGSFQINQIFTTDYANYRLLLTIDTLAGGAGNQYVWWRMNSNGTDETTTAYNSANSYVGVNTPTTTSTPYNSNISSLNRGVLAMAIGNSGTTAQYNGLFGEYTIANPMRPFSKRVIGNYYGMQASFQEYIYQVGSGLSSGSGTYNGLTIGTDTGAAISGRAVIYALNE